MTPEQYERWQDFALRMARTCFTRRRNPSTKEIVENVQSFFDCFDPDDVQCIVDWDHSERYPEGHKHYRKTYRTRCWHCGWRGRLNDCPYDCEDGQIFNYEKPQCVTDMCSNLEECWNPHHWDRLSEREYERRDEQFCGPVRCCIRAGLDMASAPSMGVMGFTAGSLRRMYPEGVPDWVTGGEDHRWTTQHWDGVVPGVGLIPGCVELNGTFAEMPDTAEVWL